MRWERRGINRGGENCRNQKNRMLAPRRSERIREGIIKALKEKFDGNNKKRLKNESSFLLLHP
jgi:hypothetical protein